MSAAVLCTILSGLMLPCRAIPMHAQPPAGLNVTPAPLYSPTKIDTNNATIRHMTSPSNSTSVPSREFEHQKTLVRKHVCRRKGCGIANNECFCDVQEASCKMPANPSVLDLLMPSNFVEMGDYQERPLIARARENLQSVAGVLSLHTIFDDFVRQGRLDRIRVVKNRRNVAELPKGSDVSTMLDMLKNNHSFSLQTEFLSDPHSLSAMTQALENELGLPVTAHVYLSAGSIHVFGLHRDAYDVIVLQLSGSKEWTVCKPSWKASPNVTTSVNFTRALSPAHQALLAIRHGNARYGLCNEDEELECDNFDLSARSSCGNEMDVLYIPTASPHTASAKGNGNSISITFGLLHDGLTFLDLMKHQVDASPCFLMLCSQARDLVKSVLISGQYLWPIWGQVPTIIRACTDMKFPFILSSLQSKQCSSIRIAAVERTIELEMAMSAFQDVGANIVNGLEIGGALAQAVREILSNMRLETTVNEAIYRFNQDAIASIQRVRNLGNSLPNNASRRLLQGAGVSIEDLGVATVEQCSTSCDASCGADCDCRYTTKCGCDQSCDWVFGRGSCDSACGCNGGLRCFGCTGCDEACDAGCAVFTCAAGYEHAETECHACEGGTYTPAVGLTSCVHCPVGFYQPSPGQTACLVCSPGTYTPEVGQKRCQLAPAGYFSNTSMASRVFTCPASKFCPEGAIEPINCTKGSYCPPVSGRPLQCPENHFCSDEGMVEAMPCASNSVAPPGSDARTDCKCKADFTGPDGGPCTACLPGK